MQPQAFSELRDTGIEFLDRVPWGTHMCGFYEGEQDHTHMAMAFFKAGAAAHEHCLWITDRLTPSAILAAAEQNVEIFPYTEWYRPGSAQPQFLLEQWHRKLARALKQGYAGLRVVHCGADTFLSDRAAHQARETLLERAVKNKPVIALCPYPLKDLSLTDIIELSSTHSFTFFRGGEPGHEALATANRYNMLRTATAEVIHEIRNPITAIRALMELLHTKPEFHAYSDLFGRVIDEVDRVEQLASQFLNLARTCAPPSSAGCNLNAVIDAMRPLLEASAAKREQMVCLQLSPVPDVPCRPSEARQVILNLAQNAFEAMSANGILTITTYDQYPYAVLQVKDTGSGIPPEIMAKVSTPFFTTKGNGTGLGLPVCLRILEKYGARAAIDSSEAGTTVTVTFPAADFGNSKGPR